MLNEPAHLLGRDWPKDQRFLCMYDYAMNNTAAGAAEEFGPEPEKFLPMRWIADNGAIKNSNSLLSFGHGLRICPGRDLAKIEAVVAASMLLKRFKDVRLEPGHDKVGRMQEAAVQPDRDIRIQLIE